MNLINGKSVATDSPSDLHHEYVLGHLPVLLHPHPESALVIGLGAGLTLGGVVAHPEVRTATLVEIEFLDVMLAFVPGGLYEVTLLSLIFGFDVAFVAIHHATRMLFILFSLPFLLKILRAGKSAPA